MSNRSGFNCFMFVNLHSAKRKRIDDSPKPATNGQQSHASDKEQGGDTPNATKATESEDKAHSDMEVVTEEGAAQTPIDSLKETPGISELKVVTGGENEPAADLQLSQVDGCHLSPGCHKLFRSPQKKKAPGPEEGESGEKRQRAYHNIVLQKAVALKFAEVNAPVEVECQIVGLGDRNLVGDKIKTEQVSSSSDFGFVSRSKLSLLCTLAVNLISPIAGERSSPAEVVLLLSGGSRRRRGQQGSL